MDTNPDLDNPPTLPDRVARWLIQDGERFSMRKKFPWATAAEIAGQLDSPLAPVDQVDLACLALGLSATSYNGERVFNIGFHDPKRPGQSVHAFAPSLAMREYINRYKLEVTPEAGSKQPRRKSA